MLTDDGFQLPTPSAERAYKSAEKLLDWSLEAEHRAAVTTFADVLIGSLKGCFQAYRTVRVGREHMWERYYKLRSSEAFKARWAKLLRESIGTEACPIFYQFVTDAIMEELIKQHFPVEVAQSEKDLPPLDYEETNALRFTAGYIIRALRKKIERSAHPLMEELVLCLVEMEEKEVIEHESEVWTNTIDRGGLKHISNMTYMLFMSMELELRKQLRSGCASEELGIKANAIEKTNCRVWEQSGVMVGNNSCT